METTDWLSRCETLQLTADVLIVTRIDSGRRHFVDDGQEVGEGPDYRQRCGPIRPDEAADGRESECVLNSDERQSALIKLCRQQTVGAAYGAAGARSRTICFEQAGDIFVLIHDPGQPCGSRSDGPPMVTVWQ
jgi:hypothetical protein